MPTSTSKSKKTTSGRSLARAPRSRPSRANTDITNYSSATRWLLQHVNHERMRVVPYNTKAFSLDRMNKFLKLPRLNEEEKVEHFCAKLPRQVNHLRDLRDIPIHDTHVD